LMTARTQSIMGCHDRQARAGGPGGSRPAR